MVAAWFLVPCLVALRRDLDLLAPGRDKTSDGAVGDTAHATGGSSDHLPDEDFPALRGKDADTRNEVHAIDVDVDLRQPGLTMEMVVQHVLARCRSGAEKRLRYVIYNRRIWEASNEWRQRTYSGDNPHDKHAHFSASYDTAHEADTSPWALTDLIGDDMLPKKGDTGETVKFWQYVLSDLGYPIGEIDGVFGPKVEAAIDAFRKAAGANPIDYLSGWTGWALLRTMMDRRAGKPGPAGPAGPAGARGPQGVPGPAGPVGALTGQLTVVGGNLTVEATPPT